MRVLFAAALVPLVSLAAPAAAQSPPTPPVPAAPARADAPTPAAPPTAPVPATPPRKLTAEEVDRGAALSMGREIARLVGKRELDSIMVHADPSTGNPAEVRERIRTALGQIGEQLGTETNMIAERVMLVNGGVQYWRDEEFSAVPVPLVLRVVIAPSGKWRGFTISSPDALPSAEEV